MISNSISVFKRLFRSGNIGRCCTLAWHALLQPWWPGDLLRFARRRLIEESLPQVAGSLTFATVFALVPLMTLIFAIFTIFPMFNTLRTALEHYFVDSVMPKAIANTILSYLTQFSSKATRLSAFGAVALVLTSVAMIRLIERVFNRIWRVKSGRRWRRRILLYWASVTLGPVLIGVSLTVSSEIIMATSSLVGGLPLLATLFYSALSVLLTAAAFTLLYTSVPNCDVDWRDAAWGGLLAALAFEVAKRGFAVFIVQFPTYSRIYGALAALPLFLLWIYLCWLITLLGALLVAALPVVKHERWWHQAVPGDAFVDAMAIFEVLNSAQQDAPSALVSAAAIREQTRLGFNEMDALLEKMAAQGWIGRVDSDAQPGLQWGRPGRGTLDYWVLLANAGLLTLADVYRVFVFGAITPVGASAASLARQVEAAVEQGLGVTLAAHFGGHSGE